MSATKMTPGAVLPSLGAELQQDDEPVLDPLEVGGDAASLLLDGLDELRPEVGQGGDPLEAFGEFVAVMNPQQDGRQPAAEVVTQLQAVNSFADVYAGVNLQIAAIDAQIKQGGGDAQLRASWPETRRAVVEALRQSEEAVIAQLRLKFRGRGGVTAESCATRIQEIAESLAPQVQNLKLLSDKIVPGQQPAAPQPDNQPGAEERPGDAVRRSWRQ